MYSKWEDWNTQITEMRNPWLLIQSNMLCSSNPWNREPFGEPAGGLDLDQCLCFFTNAVLLPGTGEGDIPSQHCHLHRLGSWLNRTAAPWRESAPPLLQQHGWHSERWVNSSKNMTRGGRCNTPYPQPKWESTNLLPPLWRVQCWAGIVVPEPKWKDRQGTVPELLLGGLWAQSTDYAVLLYARHPSVQST